MQVSRIKIDGMNVIDAKKDVTLTVIKSDIAKAKKKDPGCCVMAQAIKRELNTEARVHVSRVYLKVPGKKLYERYSVSSKLRNEIVAFDRGGEFFEGTYKLRVCPPDRRLGAKKKTGPKQTAGKKRVAPVLMPGVRTGPATWTTA